MFIPLHDANRLVHIRLQFVVLAIIAINVLVYLLVNLAGTEESAWSAAIAFGYIPAVVNDFEELPAQLLLIPEELSLVSYAFLHADFMHLLGNMLFLWVFGDNVEDAMGHVRFIVFYLACCVAAAFAHSLVDPQSVTPLIGASGGVSGVIAAYLVLHPRVKVWVLAFGRLPLRLPAWIPLLLWIVFQFIMVVATPDDQVSFAAHIGGLIAGFGLIFLLKRRGVPLFDRELKLPQAVIVEPPPLPKMSPDASDSVSNERFVSKAPNRIEAPEKSLSKPHLWGRGNR